jgi:hypothetical protein
VARVGSSWRRGGGLLIAAVGEGRVDGADAKGARGCIASVLHPGAAAPRSTGITKGEREDGDDRDVTRRQHGSPLAEEARRRAVGSQLVGLRSGRKGVGQLVGRRPTQGEKAFLINLLLFPIQFKSQINPNKIQPKSQLHTLAFIIRRDYCFD